MDTSSPNDALDIVELSNMDPPSFVTRVACTLVFNPSTSFLGAVDTCNGSGKTERRHLFVDVGDASRSSVARGATTTNAWSLPTRTCGFQDRLDLAEQLGFSAAEFGARSGRASAIVAATVPKLRRPHIASPDEVKITRNGDTAVFEYADPRVATTHLTMEAGKLAKMSDADLLAYWNEQIAASEQFIRTQKPLTLTEIPVGKPQVEYSEKCDQWVPRGHVLRAVILSDAAIEPDLDEPFVSVDDRDFTLREFFKMVGTFGGWGMRLAFVPDDEIHEQPRVKMQEPEEEETAE